MIAWIKLQANVPEYGLYEDNEDDLELLLQWLFDFDFDEFDDETKRQEKTQWLDSLPVGTIVPIPERQEYKIIKVEK